MAMPGFERRISEYEQLAEALEQKRFTALEELRVRNFATDSIKAVIGEELHLVEDIRLEVKQLYRVLEARITERSHRDLDSPAMLHLSTYLLALRDLLRQLSDVLRSELVLLTHGHIGYFWELLPNEETIRKAIISKVASKEYAIRKHGLEIGHEQRMLNVITRYRAPLSFAVAFLLILFSSTNSLGQNEYITRSGDTLSGLGRKFNVAYELIARENNLDPQGILPTGIVLKIPKAGDKPPIQRTKAWYEVHKGDTLYGIAQRFSMTVDELKQINSIRGDTILVGQRIYVLVAEPVAQAAPPQPPVRQGNPAKLQFHSVAKGDTFNSIASHYGIPPQLLASLNPGITDYTNLLLFTRIKVPDIGERPQVDAFTWPGVDRIHLTGGWHVAGSNGSIRNILYHLSDSVSSTNGPGGEQEFFLANNPKSSHYFIYMDGEVVQIVKENMVANHCAGHNRGSIGIECEGRLTDGEGSKVTLTPIQRKKLEELIAYLQQKYGVDPSNILPHHHFNKNKACPGKANIQLVSSDLDKMYPRRLLYPQIAKNVPFQ